MKKISKIEEAANYFYKMAGLLQVPLLALKELEEWIEGSYCEEVGQELTKRIEENKRRDKEYDKIEKTLKKWMEVYSAINDLQYNDGSIDALIKAIGSSIVIPIFDINGESSDGMNGEVRSGNCVILSISKNRNNFYSYGLYIDYSGEEVDELHNNIDSENLKKLIIRDKRKIDNILNDFDELRINYETYGNEYLKNLQMVRGYCVSKAVEGRKEIKIKGIDLPYTKGRDEEVKIVAEYVRTKEDEVLHGDNDFAGLWYGGVPNKNNPRPYYIGTIYIKSPILYGSKIPTNLNELKNDIEGMKKVGRHELQHFVQTFLTYLYGSGGLPSDKLRSKNLPLDESGRTIHSLRDVEFYTRLSDSAHYFNEAKKHLPLQLHEDFMLNCIGKIGEEEFKNKAIKFLKEIDKNNHRLNLEQQFNYILYKINKSGISRVKEFFEDLKQHQPLKYGKAVAVFVNEVR
jgi:hypothetical protein